MDRWIMKDIDAAVREDLMDLKHRELLLRCEKAIIDLQHKLDDVNSRLQKPWTAEGIVDRVLDDLEITQRQCEELRKHCEMHLAELSQLERNAEIVYQNHRDIVAALTAERDEARREICQTVFIGGGIRPAEYAENRGWDCFKQGDLKQGESFKEDGK